MKPTLAILAAVLLLAGCGQAKVPSSSFVGTWRADPQTRLVIAEVTGGYLATIVFLQPGTVVLQPAHNQVLLARRGNELIGTTKVVGTTKVIKTKVVVGYLATTGHLTFKSGSDSTVELTKVSDSTAIPTPSP